MKIYRIENPNTMHGMWYRLDGTFDPFINRLTQGISKDLPMEFDERYHAGGQKWFSGCPSIELMNHWFTPLDALELHQNGYRLFQFEAVQFKVEEFQTIFTREGVQHQQEIPLETVWDLSTLGGQRTQLLLPPPGLIHW